jgi:hypothetical protein
MNRIDPPPEWGLGGLLPPGEGVAEDRLSPIAGGAGWSEGETSPY